MGNLKTRRHLGHRAPNKRQRDLAFSLGKQQPVDLSHCCMGEDRDDGASPSVAARFPLFSRKRPPSQTRAGQSTGEQEEGLALKRQELRACRAGLGAARLWASEPCLRNWARRPSSFLS